MRDDRLFRVLVLGGIALAGAAPSVMGCSGETVRPEGPPIVEPPVNSSTATPTAAPTSPMKTPATVEPPREGPPPPNPPVGS
ncbi:MAG: hypothetical protein U0414_35205 [Polyangiaceae bacterium]